jgi:NtrC-family two-component system sensor histidine kinase KinB
MTILMLADGKLGQLDARQQKVLLAAKEDSERLHRIIEDLLNIGRMESGQARFEFQAIGPKQIVSQAVDPMTERLKSKNIQLSAIVPDDLPDVRADPSCIGLVLTNLLSNALKYTPAGGKIAVSAALDGQDVVFTVADSGSGVPQEYAGRIFERFFRVPQREGPAGAGLGLAIAKEIVDAHDGSIRLRSDSRGSGSTFEFTLKSAAVGRT